VEGGILAARIRVEIRPALEHSSAWISGGHCRRPGKPGSMAAKDGRRFNRNRDKKNWKLFKKGRQVSL